MNSEFNSASLDGLCAALAYAMGIDPPGCAAKADARLTAYMDRAFDGNKADRVFMYNPDAIAQWLYQKYPRLFMEARARTELEAPFRTVMPSVTPVCFGTLYTGAQPEVHGIQRYEKPVISIDTLFDRLIKAGKRPVIIAETGCSLSRIFLERPMDYFIYDTIEEANAKAAEVILQDEYDFIVVYNGNYDMAMHKYGPESLEALSELRANVQAYALFDALILEHWKNHRTLIGFAMDHGAHEIDGGCGSHGLDMPEDLNIVHLYQAHGPGRGKG